jgi:hypothetical protein
MTRTRRAIHLTTRALLLAAPLLAAGCIFDSESDSSGGHPPRFTLEELRAAPETLFVDGKGVTAQAFVWRDFMPSTPPEGTPLLGDVDLLPVGSGELPNASDLFVWVVNGTEVWVGALEHEGPGPSGGERYHFAGGPRWGPGTKVDVVVGLRTAPKRVDLVADRGVPILRTE